MSKPEVRPFQVLSLSHRVPTDGEGSSPNSPSPDISPHRHSVRSKSHPKCKYSRGRRLERHLQALRDLRKPPLSPRGWRGEGSRQPLHPSLLLLRQREGEGRICQRDIAGRFRCRWGEAGAGSQSAAGAGSAELPGMRAGRSGSGDGARHRHSPAGGSLFLRPGGTRVLLERNFLPFFREF